MKTRFIKSVTATAAQKTAPLPWTRGRTRAAFIAKRNAQVVLRKSA